MASSGFRPRLPRHAEAVVPAAKLRDYLLDADHPVGHAKALFFARLGFSRERWPLLEAELRDLVAHEPAWAMPAGPHGQKFLVAGTIRGPWRRRAGIVTFWIVRGPGGLPRFVTAYPRSQP